MNTEKTLEQYREEFARRRFLAMPLAGAIMWAVIGLSGLFLKDFYTVWVIFIGTGCIVYLGIFISKFTGENFLDHSKGKNTFDALFFYNVGMALMVYSIAIPFFLVDYTSLPLSVGILTGLMWLPLSWIIRHWIGLFHSMVRTVCIVAVWYLFPEDRFVVIPMVIVIIYVITIYIFEQRWQGLRKA